MLRIGLLTAGLLAITSVAVSIIAVPSHAANAERLGTLADAFGLDGCDKPCWHGIELGETTIGEAKRILDGDPNIVMLADVGSGCQIIWNMKVEDTTWTGRICTGTTTAPTEAVMWIDLSASDRRVDTGVMLLDATLLLGQPTGAQCAAFYPHHGPGSYGWSLIFGSGTELGGFRELPFDGPLFDPAMAVTWIHYDARVRKAYYRPTSWRGFKSERFEGMGSSGRCMIVME